jgi:drug/metabolite transporter (DMT)-like permease
VNTQLALAAAIATAVCNAVAALLQKAGAGKVKPIRTYNLTAVTRLFHRAPYVLGLFLDLCAGILTLMAVSVLPLFLVQAILASCVVLTAALEHVIHKRKLTPATYIAAFMVMGGLVCVGFAAQSGPAGAVSQLLYAILLASPVILATVGGLAIKMKGRASYILLGVLGGTGFAAVSIIGRIITYPHNFLLVLANPLIWVLIVDGTLGMYFFTAALQRTLATITNGIMVSAQTIVPIVTGVLFLGDTARGGLWALVWLGCALVVTGCTYIAFTAS